MNKTVSSSASTTVGFVEALSERYLNYALATITDRSFPDVRDGMKPVHRRLLYAMRQLGLSPTSSPKKSARVVGDVIGQYHPHGDVAVYEALVRMAQDFSLRYPLIVGQGNFGTTDGDAPAAMRYTEAKLSAVALLLLDGLDENAVDFRTTYDESGREPVVLPGGFPHLLANGASGIAVGMATNIPPHNVAELCAAMRAMIEDPEMKDAALLKLIKGPDFPTGGTIIASHDELKEMYTSGRGSISIEANWQVEDLKGGSYQIVVYELPYQVNKADLVQQIADLIMNKKLPLLDDIRDESADDTRIVLVPKSRNVDADVVMRWLMAHTDLRTKFHVNMNVLDEGRVPRVMSLKQMLQAYLTHRQTVLVRRKQFRLSAVQHRLLLLRGFQLVYLNLDEVIQIIRNNDEPKPLLMQRFKLVDEQAEAILNMRLRALRKLDEMAIKKELKELQDEQKNIESLLASEKLQWQAIDDELTHLQQQFATTTPLGRRRSKVDKKADTDASDVLQLMSNAAAEPVTVVLSKQGWIRTMKGHDLDLAALKFRDGDELLLHTQTQSNARVGLMGSDGRMFTLAVESMPTGRGFGESVRLLCDMATTAEPVAMIPFAADASSANQELLLIASDAKALRVPLSAAVAQTRAGKQLMIVREGETLTTLLVVTAPYVLVITQRKHLGVVALSELPLQDKGVGQLLCKLPARDQLFVVMTVDAGHQLTWRGAKETPLKLKNWILPRGSMPKPAAELLPRNLLSIEVQV